MAEMGIAAARRELARRVRRYSSIANDMLASKFFNRAEELKTLNELLTPVDLARPGKLIILTGPKDSGKSALIREYRRRQVELRQYKGVSSYNDLRQGSKRSPEHFAKNLSSSLRDCVKNFKGCVETEAISWGRRGSLTGRDSLTRVMDSLENFCVRRRNLVKPEQHEGFQGNSYTKQNYIDGFPTIFIDEANAFHMWSAEEGGAATLDMLFRFFVRLVKQECCANLVLASSENLLKNWVLKSDAFSGHNVRIFNVGHLTEDESKRFVMGNIPVASKVEVEKIWDDIYSRVGGAIVYLFDVSDLAHGPPTTIAARWERMKLAHLRYAERKIVQALTPAHFPNSSIRAPPSWTKAAWVKLMEKLARAPDGVVPLSAVSDIEGVDSMIEHDLLHYREAGEDTAGDLGRVDEWPTVSKAAHRVMIERLKIRHVGSSHTIGIEGCCRNSCSSDFTVIQNC